MLSFNVVLSVTDRERCRCFCNWVIEQVIGSQLKDIMTLEKLRSNEFEEKNYCTVWCALWTGEIVGPYFFENEVDNYVTVMVQLWEGAELLFLVRLWYFKPNFLLLSHRGDIDWPLRSCDLISLDFFLRSYLKEGVYVNKPATILELRENIKLGTVEIELDLYDCVMKNFGKRMGDC